MTPSALAWFLDDEPSERFRVYCRGNVGEIVPDVATPLSTTITIEAFRRGFLELLGSTGAFRSEELADKTAVGGVFGGYLYFNLSFARSFAARTPGLTVADIDRQMFGSIGVAPPYLPVPGDRNVTVRVRALVGSLVRMVRRRAPDLDAERAETREWVASLPREPTDDEVVALAAGFRVRFERDLRSLLAASFGAGIPMSVLERLGARAERARPGLLVRALSGLGAIETAQPAIALWRLGRAVASSPVLTEAFDQGVDGLRERLVALTGTDVTTFLERFEAFLTAHGHRGPNEVELASDTWATAPDTALAAIERLRLAPASADPEQAAARLSADRAAARDELRRAVPWPIRRLVGRLLVSAGRGAAQREQAKGTLVLDLSGLRTALFHLADRLVLAGTVKDRTDFFMLTVDELSAAVGDPASFADRIAERRHRYDELNGRMPPFAFEHRPPDPSTWPRRDDRTMRSQASAGEVLTGIGVAAGAARGRVRIIRDPSDPGAISPGEVLVAPITDPAWTPLFLAAVAVVVDVGALQSHAAIVARELGIPAVVSVDAATMRLTDGDEVEVDGDRGVVRVLSRAT